MPAIPIRTCVSCGRKAPKADLLRIAKTREGLVGFQLAGRGAYVCAASPCVERAVDRNLFARTPRSGDKDFDRGALLQGLMEKVTQQYA